MSEEKSMDYFRSIDFSQFEAKDLRNRKLSQKTRLQTRKASVILFGKFMAGRKQYEIF